jgi:hypothetical protein
MLVGASEHGYRVCVCRRWIGPLCIAAGKVAGEDDGRRPGHSPATPGAVCHIFQQYVPAGGAAYSPQAGLVKARNGLQTNHANSNGVAWFKRFHHVLLNLFSTVDDDGVCAANIVEHVAAVLGINSRVTPRNVRIAKDDVAACMAADNHHCVVHDNFRLFLTFYFPYYQHFGHNLFPSTGVLRRRHLTRSPNSIFY